MGPRSFDTLERLLRLTGGLAGLATLAVSIRRMLGSVGHPAGRQSGAGARFLRAPFLALGTVLFAAGMIGLWRPLNLTLSARARITCLAAGGVIYFPSLGLYLWGLRTLGANFAPSTAFGVRLQPGHRLVTVGPYAFLRHPMYAAVISAGIGGLLLYRTRAVLCFALAMFGLVFRARREEQALADEFGPGWERYRERVPAWLPLSIERACTRRR